MKYTFKSRRQKASEVIEAQEDKMIYNSLYKPNEIVSILDRRFTVSYALVRDGILTYLLHGKKNSYYVTEQYMVSNQI